MTTLFSKQVFHLKILRGIRSISEKLEGQAEDLFEVMQGEWSSECVFAAQPFEEQVNLGISTTNNTRAEGDIVTHLAEFLNQTRNSNETNKWDGKTSFWIS